MKDIFWFSHYIVIQIDNNPYITVVYTDGILSYSMPQGDKRNPEWEFYDSTYDGYWDDELQRGLGQLTDGKVGIDNFRMGYYDTERGIVFFSTIVLLLLNIAKTGINKKVLNITLTVDPR